MLIYKITPPKNIINTVIELDGSKSESNRLLIINFLAKGNYKDFYRLSTSDDTNSMIRALSILEKNINSKPNKTNIINVGHGGTTIRFICALAAFKKCTIKLTGSKRMQQRPIKILVDALIELGANIKYENEEGYPPLLIKGTKNIKNYVEIDGSVSSQYISALILIAPYLENGLTIKFKNKVLSLPYINMTIELSKYFGSEIKFNIDKKEIVIKKGKYSIKKFEIEADWSGASYWYSICSLCKGSIIKLKGLKKDSLQADSVLPKLYNKLGIETKYINNNTISIKNKSIDYKNTIFDFNFINCPDIAQTYAVSLFGLNLKGKLTGLDNLKIKETDRLNALKNELNKFSCKISHNNENEIYVKENKDYLNKPITVKTYNDHRMAMSIAPLALVIKNILIEDPMVVTKSYPKFWEDLKKAGFIIQ